MATLFSRNGVTIQDITNEDETVQIDRAKKPLIQQNQEICKEEETEEESEEEGGEEEEDEDEDEEITVMDAVQQSLQSGVCI